MVAGLNPSFISGGGRNIDKFVVWNSRRTSGGSACNEEIADKEALDADVVDIRDGEKSTLTGESMRLGGRQRTGDDDDEHSSIG